MRKNASNMENASHVTVNVLSHEDLPGQKDHQVVKEAADLREMLVTPEKTERTAKEVLMETMALKVLFFLFVLCVMYKIR